MAIVGYMGSGKSTVGLILADKLGWEFVDLDEVVALEAGRTISRIFEESGEQRFRDLEHRALLDALDGGPGGTPKRVVACGGGAVTHPGSRERLREVPTVFLREETDVLFRRTRDTGRPLRAANAEEFARRYADRLAHYREVADLEVSVNGRPPERVAEEVARWLSA